MKGGADPLVRGRRPRRPAGTLQDADVAVAAAGRGRPARTRGSAPPKQRGGFSALSSLTKGWLVDRRQKTIVCPTARHFHWNSMLQTVVWADTTAHRNAMKN